MALPTLTKTWQFLRSDGVTPTTNRRLTAAGSGLDTQRQVLLHVVNDMLNFDLFPWTVIGSSNGGVGGSGVSYGMDGVNRWTSTADLIFATNTGTTHSWIVLQQAGIHSTFQICFDLVNGFSGSNAAGSYMCIYACWTGFGTANGGTNGTNLTRPTGLATHEHVFGHSTTTNVNFLDGNTTIGSSPIRDYVVSTMQSDDGECFRCLIRIPYTRFSVHFCVEKVQSPIPEWTTPYLGRWMCVSGATSDTATYAYLNDAAYMLTRHPGGTAGGIGLHIASEGYGAAMAGQNLALPNELSGEWEFYPCPIYSFTTVGVRGRYGRSFDQWWCAQSIRAGDCFPADGSRQFMCIGQIVVPWDGSIPDLS
jgi:hypothetical protein